MALGAGQIQACYLGQQYTWFQSCRLKLTHSEITSHFGENQLMAKGVSHPVQSSARLKVFVLNSLPFILFATEFVTFTIEFGPFS